MFGSGLLTSLPTEDVDEVEGPLVSKLRFRALSMPQWMGPGYLIHAP